MSANDSTYSNDSIWCIKTDDNAPVHALEYLNNPANFRTFSQGLTELITTYGYQENPCDLEAKTRFVLDKLSLTGTSISKSTVKDWFLDKRRPSLASNSRTLMFCLCFALSASLADVRWFFHHVYFDRCFNCHTIEEAVYYYCFSNRLSYAHAKSLLEAINSYPALPICHTASHVFTTDIRNRLDECTNDQQLLDFFRENKAIFAEWNKSALSCIDYYVTAIQGKPADKAVIEARRAGKTILPSECEDCGLVIQEYLFGRSDHMLDYIRGKSITSIDFMLNRMIKTNSGISKNTVIPAIVKANFPSKRTFSDILNKSGTSTSYDSIRKCLILLKFYHFWASLLLKPALAEYDLFDVFQEETDALLTSCGYDELYPGNPYDWLFLWASTTEHPLDALRDALTEAAWESEA